MWLDRLQGLKLVRIGSALFFLIKFHHNIVITIMLLMTAGNSWCSITTLCSALCTGCLHAGAQCG